MIHSILHEEHGGFSGITHWLLAMFLFFVMWVIPWSWGVGFINSIQSSKLFAFMVFLIIGGASLLPDLDSSPLQEGGSTAVYQLGMLGNALSVLCITISGVVYSILHGRGDDKPKSQHRMLFHAPIMAIMIHVSSFFIPDTNDTFANYGLAAPILIHVCMFMASISVYLGSSMLYYKVLKLIGKQRHTQILCMMTMILSFFYMRTMPFHQLRLVMESIGIGYAFHIIGDLVTKGSAPVLFPIPVRRGGKWSFWWKPNILGPFMVTTGGAVNVVINFALFGANIFMIWFLWFK